MRTHLVPVLAVLLATPGAADPRTSAPAPAALAERAALEGSVRVLVGLDAAARSEPLLPDAASRARQRERIGSAQAEVLGALAGAPHFLNRSYRTLPLLALEVGPAALEALGRSPRVTWIQEDRLHRPVVDASVPQVEADQTALHGFDGTGQTVVVLDTGVDAAHPNLQGKIVDEACFALGSPQGSGDCPGGGSAATGPGAGTYCTYSPDCFHGTHVAGIAVGAGPAFAGVAPGADLIPIQVFSEFRGSACPAGQSPCPASYASDQVAALEHVYDVLRHQRPIASVNMSLGGQAWADEIFCDAANPATKMAIDQLRAVKIATVVAAGNDGYVNAISEPGCISSAVSVGAVDDADQIAWFSNAASFLSLWAPGVAIRAPLFQTTGYADASGTSMATPHAAGAWAVLRQGAPGATVDVVLGTLQATGLPIPDVEADTTRLRIQAAAGLLFPCRDGVDQDGDGRVDHPEDPGCSDPADLSERDFQLPCDNGVDDDGDGLVDVADAGCREPGWVAEDPACNDGVDNDDDGSIDFDGAGAAEPDPECAAGWQLSEAPRVCGLGAELAVILAPPYWLYRRRLSAGRARGPGSA